MMAGYLLEGTLNKSLMQWSRHPLFFGHFSIVATKSHCRAPNTPRLLTIPDAKSLLTPGTLTQFAPSSKGTAEQLSSDSHSVRQHTVRAFNKSGKAKLLIRSTVVEAFSFHFHWLRLSSH